jgi:hypothetical protein
MQKYITVSSNKNTTYPYGKISIEQTEDLKVFQKIVNQ